jgi:digeranylgeranylglycerophospholipid reductase
MTVIYDAIVVGAGPGGSTTARFAAERGLNVLMLDKRREIGFPVQCGEFMPDTDEIKRMFPNCGDIDDLFDTPQSLISSKIRDISIYSPKMREYSMDFKGYAVERREYDKHLVDLALKEGAELGTRTLVRKVKGEMVATNKGNYRAKVVVGADGPMSTVAGSARFQKNEVLVPALTCQVEGEFEPVAKMFFGNIAPGGYAWIIPKKGGANVGLGAQRRFSNENVRVLFERFLESNEFRGREITGGYVPMSGPLEKTVGGNVLLVGDAAGQVMASNGGGIPTAMICGKIAGRTIANHIRDRKFLESYDGLWRAAIGKELKNSLTTRRLGDWAFRRSFLLNFAIRCLGRRGLSRAIRCQRLVPW